MQIYPLLSYFVSDFLCCACRDRFKKKIVVVGCYHSDKGAKMEGGGGINDINGIPHLGILFKKSFLSQHPSPLLIPMHENEINFGTLPTNQ